MVSFESRKKYIKAVKKRVSLLTIRPPNKVSSAKFLVGINLQSAPMPLKNGENVV